MLQPRPHVRRGGRWPLVLGGVVAVLFLLARQQSSSRDEDAAARPVIEERFKQNVELAVSAWPRVETIQELQTLWELPAGAPHGVLFVAHGCSHQGSDFWLKSPRCLECLGLPEEVAITRAAVKRGYAVVAVSSYDRESKCWQNRAVAQSEDLQRVPAILRHVMQQEGLQGLPLYAFGASSGGGIALRLAQAMPEVTGVICQINPVNPGVFDMSGQGGRTYPPTVFVHMAQRDPEKAATVTEALKILKKAGVAAAEIRYGPQPVTLRFLQRAQQLTPALAEGIIAKLREAGWLDERGYFTRDPRSRANEWRVLLRPLVGETNLEPDQSPIGELFNVAWARHEIISETTDACLTWLETGGKKGVPLEWVSVP